MKILIAILLTCVIGRAASPSFSSFNTNQFSTNSLFISIKSAAQVTNLNINSTSFTFNGTTITNINQGSGGGDTLWTNIGGTLQPTEGSFVQVTNLTSYVNLISQGSFRMPITSTVNLVLGTNCVNPSDHATLGIIGAGLVHESSLSLTLGSGSGTILVLMNNDTNQNGFHIEDGIDLCDGSGGFIRLNGDWETEQYGDGLVLYNTGVIWTELTRFFAATNTVIDGVWQYVDGNIKPVSEDTERIRINDAGAVSLGPNADDFGPSVADSFLSSRSVLKGDSAGNNLTVAALSDENFEYYGDFHVITSADPSVPRARWWLEAQNTNNLYSILVAQADVGDEKLTLEGGDGSVTLFDFRPSVASSGSARAYQFNTLHTLTNGDTYASIATAGIPQFSFAPVATNTGSQIILGPGTTNMLRRAGRYLDYVNTGTATEIAYRVFDGNGSFAYMGIETGGTPFFKSSAGTLYIDQSGGSDGLVLNNSAFGARTLGTLDLGQSSTAWANISLTNSIMWQKAGVATNLLIDTYTQGSPEGVVPALMGSVDRDTTNGRLYVKASGSGTTGWALLSTTTGSFPVVGTGTSPYTVLATDFTILVDTSGGAVTVNLPACSGQTRVLNVKKISADANAVTLDGSGGETIDGAATQSTTTQWFNFQVQSSGTNWFIL